MGKKVKTQWHPAFCSAIKMELLANKSELDYHSEFGLNSKPILIDLLVITKSADIIITNEIGHIFKGHNIFEYKSPEDALDIDTFFKGIAYACLYKANASRVNERRIEDITLSFVRQGKPIKLMEQLTAYGMSVEKKYNGVYYIKSEFPIGIQFVVTSELRMEEHIWLKSLTTRLSSNEAKYLTLEASKFDEKDAREWTDSIFDVVMAENMQVFENLKEGSEMCEALKILMKPEMDAEIEKVVAEVVAENDAVYAKEIAAKDAEIAAKDADIAAKDAEIAELKAKLAKKTKSGD